MVDEINMAIHTASPLSGCTGYKIEKVNCIRRRRHPKEERPEEASRSPEEHMPSRGMESNLAPVWNAISMASAQGCIGCMRHTHADVSQTRIYVSR